VVAASTAALRQSSAVGGIVGVLRPDVTAVLDSVTPPSVAVSPVQIRKSVEKISRKLKIAMSTLKSSLYNILKVPVPPPCAFAIMTSYMTS